MAWVNEAELKSHLMESLASLGQLGLKISLSFCTFSSVGVGSQSQDASLIIGTPCSTNPMNCENL